MQRYEKNMKAQNLQENFLPVSFRQFSKHILSGANARISSGGDKEISIQEPNPGGDHTSAVSERTLSKTEVVRPFLNYYMQLWNDVIAYRILEQIDNYHSVAFVLPTGIDKIYKDSMRKFFSSESRRVVFKDFNQLRDGLNEDFVVLFSFRYTDERYKTYPNSFDPFCIN